MLKHSAADAANEHSARYFARIDTVDKLDNSGVVARPIVAVGHITAEYAARRRPAAAERGDISRVHTGLKADVSHSIASSYHTADVMRAGRGVFVSKVKDRSVVAAVFEIRRRGRHVSTVGNAANTRSTRVISCGTGDLTVVKTSLYQKLSVAVAYSYNAAVARQILLRGDLRVVDTVSNSDLSCLGNNTDDTADTVAYRAAFRGGIYRNLAAYGAVL